MAGATLKIQRHPRVEEVRGPQCTLEDLSFTSLGNVWINGYALHWKNDADPRPIVVHSHGYGSSCAVQRGWVQAGFNVVGIDIRGCGRSFEALPLPSRHGYVLTGIETPETVGIARRGNVITYGASKRPSGSLVPAAGE